MSVIFITILVEAMTKKRRC